MLTFFVSLVAHCIVWKKVSVGPWFWVVPLLPLLTSYAGVLLGLRTLRRFLYAENDIVNPQSLIDELYSLATLGALA